MIATPGHRVRHLTGAACITAYLACSSPVLAGEPPEIYREPRVPLDPRVPADRVTESDPPPLPERLLIPLPPDHRLASSRGEVPIDAEHWALAKQSLDRGMAALLALQHESGGWMIEAQAAPSGAPDRAAPVAVAVTALAVKAIVQARSDDSTDQQPDRQPDHQPDGATTLALRRALAFILSARNDDGSFEGGALTNYVTATVTSALAGLDDVREDVTRDEAAMWLQRAQWDQSEGINAKKDWFGGAGYGSRGRPDLSNTQMMLDALYDAGMSPDEPSFQKALAFLSRTQNLKAVNHAEWSGNDGGFVYTPANGGESMASEYAGEGRTGEKLPEGAARSLRSYGSMTYAGFKSLLYAGLGPDDPRVRAAFDWIRRHWTFDENPGLGQQGLYYYYHGLARALRVAQQDRVTGADGVVHNWREELIDALAQRQNEDGSWRNEADRWLEGNAPLATAYALLSLQEALKRGTHLDDGTTGTREPGSSDATDDASGAPR